jgi:aminodeoxyfutalosine synthase
VPLPELGELANLVRERKNGNAAYYNINTHLNPTNVCVYRCVFCAFRSDLRDPKGYVMDDEQILARGAEAVETGCTEMHIVGGLHHQEIDWYAPVHSCTRLTAAAFEAWTAVELDWFRG